MERWCLIIDSKEKSEKQKSERLGKSIYNKFGSKLTITEYNRYSDITIRFDNGYELKHRDYSCFKNTCRSPYCKTVYGHGYIGEGKYKTGYADATHTKQYTCWRSMIQRCYSEKYHKKKPTYKDCEVCEEWLNFQNFAKWYDENYYQIDNEQMSLDKDILHKGNKIYSPDNCVFVDNRINSLFTKSNKVRGDTPIGVKHNGNKFTSMCSIIKDNIPKDIHIGTFNTPEEAFYAYKQFKEKYIKQVADFYKDKIPNKLYNAMYNYEVEITD